MYGEKLSVAGFFGSIPDIVSDDGNHQYTIDKKKAYAEYPDTRAIALQDRFGGWIRDDVKMVNDTNADQVTASDQAIREARSRVDGVKDVIPIYVRPNTEDSNTLQNNNTAISNYANNQIAKWVQKGGIDKEWDAYVKKVSEPTLGLDANIKEAAPDRKKPGLLDRIADHLRRYWQLWILSAPALFFVGLFSYVPMWGIQLAFREFDPTKGLTGGKFVGFKYFLEFFHNPLFGEIMTNTIRISLWTLVMGFIFPIILALLINQIGSKKIKGFVQTITYMPHFISVVVIVSMLNIFLTPGTGILGRFFGEESLMGSTSAITAVYWISEVWQHVGWNSIIYLAALAGVNTSLYEAAKIDGAGRLQLIRYVDIPAIMPTCAILLIMNMGSVLNVGFDKIYLMQNSLNMPATEVIATYTYKIGIINGQYSYSTAIGLFNTLVNFIFLITANAIAKRVSDTSIF